MILFAAVGLCALLLPQMAQALPPIGIQPRIAVPIGDFADVAGLGIGGGITCQREVKGYPGLVSIGILKFGEKDIGSVKSNTRAIYVNVGSRYAITEIAGGKLSAKIDFSRQFVHTESEGTVLGITFSASANSGTTKLFPGIVYETGPLGAEIEYDLAGEWLGINLSYTIGGGQE